jgi:hypothetical protein
MTALIVISVLLGVVVLVSTAWTVRLHRRRAHATQTFALDLHSKAVPAVNDFDFEDG